MQIAMSRIWTQIANPISYDAKQASFVHYLV